VNQITISQAIKLLICTAACLAGFTALAEDALPDTSKWACKWCEYNTGATYNLSGGFGYVSNDSYKFGQYTGLGTKGSFAIFDGEGKYRAEDGHNWELFARVLGSDRISAGASGGKQGSYDLYMDYDQFPNLIQDTARTPLSGNTALQLPANWVRADTTAGMTELQNSLHPVSLEEERRRLTLGGSLLPARDWTTALRYRRDEKTGRRATGAPIGGPLIAGFPFQTQSTLLAKPVDSVTHLLDANASYLTERSHVNVGYQGSVFDQKNDSLTWQNPFNDLTGSGADAGRMALPPDNQFHQLYATLGTRLGNATRVTARLAIGRMEQNESLLPYSITPGLQNPLPRSSADGEVNTRNVQLKVGSRPTRNLSLNAAFTYNDRHNETPRTDYDYIITDTTLASDSRTNLNYSFTRESLDLNGAYRFNQVTRVLFGYKRNDIERTLQQIEKNSQDSYWAAVALSPHATLDFDLRYTRSERDGSEFGLVPETEPPQNPLIRKYNMADRDRDAWKGAVFYTPSQVVSIGLTVESTTDEYPDSAIGLTEADNLSASIDASVNPSPEVRMNFFASHQDIESTQLGSQSFSTPTWGAESKDSFGSAGFTFSYMPDGKRFSLNLNYLYSASFGAIEIQDSIDPAQQFPDNDTTLNRAELYLDYRASDELSWRLGWLYEKYDSTNWSIDGVNPDTMANVLSLGEKAFNYSVHVPVISMSYEF
jgi:MtrB/PioB family decaheme-associated outer membrane protein